MARHAWFRSHPSWTSSSGALRMRPLCVCCLIATLSGVHARGADASRPHSHGGQLAKYQAQAPSAYGLSVDGVPLEQLRSGKPVLRMTTVAGGFQRSVSIQDVNAPPSVVWGRIMDLPKYPKMVDGCVECMIHVKSEACITGQHGPSGWLAEAGRDSRQPES